MKRSDRRTFLIAECGANPRTAQERREYVLAAKNAGFDAAKFQLYDDGVISCVSDPRLREMLAARKLDAEAANSLVLYCAEWDFPVFFTPMYTEAVEIANETGTPFMKVRLADQKDVALLIRIGLTGFSGTVFYSTENPHEVPKDNLQPLFCVPKYPATVDDYAPLMAKGDGMVIGCSLHAPDKWLFTRLCELGCPAIEMHVKADGVPDSELVDPEVSVSFSDAKEWIKEARRAWETTAAVKR